MIFLYLHAMWVFPVVVVLSTFNGHVSASDVARQARMTTVKCTIQSAGMPSEEPFVQIFLRDQGKLDKSLLTGILAASSFCETAGFNLQCELVMDMGYSCVTSQAATADGYIIDIDRVGLPQEARYMKRPENGASRPPILLVPGITIDSGLWFVHYPPQSVGYVLADREYDVWSMNTRDSACCSRHKNLSQDDNRYWRWSFDEIGRYDIAAAIDHVLNATGSTRIPVLVYSQSFLSAVILLSTRPEYNDKIDILLGYAPVTPPSTHRFPFAQLEAFVDTLLFLLDPKGESGHIHLPEPIRRFLQGLCYTFHGQPCALFLTLTTLCSSEQLNKTRTPVLLNHALRGTSYQNMRHYYQLSKTNRFRMFNHGPSKNSEIYGQKEPPSYPTERIRVPMALFSSEGDGAANPADTSAFIDSLPSPPPIFHYILPQQNFRHIDFSFGSNTYSLLHGPLVDTLEKYASRHV